MEADKRTTEGEEVKMKEEGKKGRESKKEVGG